MRDRVGKRVSVDGRDGCRCRGALMRRWAWLLMGIVAFLGCHPEISTRPESPDATPDPLVVPTLPLGFAYELLPGEITFASGGDLFTFDAGPAERVHLFATSAYETAPAWSPDGRSLVFSSAEEGPADLYLISIHPDGRVSPPYNLTESPNANEITPEWSPDGTVLVYAAYRLGAWGLHTIEFAYGGDSDRPIAVGDKVLTYSQRFLGHPAWSPVEPKIAFTSERGDRWKILMTDATGRGPTLFPGLSRYASSGYPAWSPDGRRIAFASTEVGNWDIYVINADGTDRVQLTDHPAPDWAPVWSPDGRWIAFSSTRDGVGNIFLVRDDGSETIRLTRGPTFDHFPAWRSVDLILDRDG